MKLATDTNSHGRPIYIHLAFALMVWLMFSQAPAMAANRCEESFSEQSVVAHLARTEALDGLIGESQRLLTSDGKQMHQVQIKENLAYVKIRILRTDQTKFQVALIKAVRAGAVAEINAGLVIGPKAIILMNRLRSVHVVANQKVRIYGSASKYVLAGNYKEQVELQKYPGAVRRRADKWSESEKADFENAMSEIGLDDAVLRLKGIDFLQFEFSTGDPVVTWSRPEAPTQSDASFKSKLGK